MNEYRLYDELSPSKLPQKKKKKFPVILLTILIILTVLLVGVIAVMFSRTPTVIHYSDHSPSATTPITADDVSISKLAEKCIPSTVYVSTTGVVGGFFQQQFASGEGSGVIISSDGYIITSASVVLSGSEINITLSDGREFPATIIGSNAQTDIAVLKIEEENLTPATFGNSDNTAIGDFVLAIGNPLAPQVMNTVTYGSVSGINKDVDINNNFSVNFFQIDITANTGNTGSPIYNSLGELIGIITGSITSNSALSFATPINDAKPLVESMLSTSNISTDSDVPMIGITGYNEPYGVIIEMVSKDSPASRAGLKPNDLIIKIDGEAINTVDRINEIRLSHKRGDSLTMTVLRDNETLDLTVTLE